MTQVKRTYDASSRQARARERSRRVVVAAGELFDRDGFRSTTIAAIAVHAGVSAEFVYKRFGTKAAIAKAVFDFVIAGDDEPVPIAQRADAEAVRAEPDVRRKIALYVDSVARRMQRSAKAQMMIRDGRHVDGSLQSIWQTMHDEGLAGMTMLGSHLLSTGQLRPGIQLDEVRDLLWNYIAVDHYERLVLARGWTLDRYAAWLTRAITAAICR